MKTSQLSSPCCTSKLTLRGWIMKAPALSLSAALTFILLGAPLMDAAKANFGIFERPFEELGTGQSSD